MVVISYNFLTFCCLKNNVWIKTKLKMEQKARGAVKIYNEKKMWGVCVKNQPTKRNTVT